MRRLSVPAISLLLVGCHYITIGDKQVDDGDGGAGGSAAGGAPPACTLPDDCPSEDTVCREATCIDGACGMMDIALGEPCSDAGGAVCDGAGTCVACHTTADCDAGEFCKASACVPELTTGTACAPTDVCASGFCTDGICCDAACGDACTACSGAITGGDDGACLPVLAGQNSANMCVAAEQCDGCGACEAIDQHWSALYGNDVGNTQTVHRLAIVPCDGFFLGGQFDGTLDFTGSNPFVAPDTFSDGYIARFDLDGTHRWSRSVTGFQAQRLVGTAVKSSGNVVVYGDFLGDTSLDGGQTTHVTGGAWQIFYAEYDGDGNHVRSMAFGGPSSQHGQALAIDHQDNSLVGGAYLSPGGDGLTFGGPQLPVSGGLAGYVAKLGPDGSYIWDADFPSITMFVRKLDTAADGTVWGAGGFLSSANFRDGNGNVPASGEDGFIIKLDPADGTTLLKLIIGGTGDQRITELIVDENDDVYVAGSFEDTITVAGGPTLSAGAGVGTFVAKVTAGGAHVWSKGYATTSIVPQDIVVRGGEVGIVGGYEGVVNLGGSDLAFSGDPGMRNLFALVLDASDGAHIYSRGEGDALDQAGTAIDIDASGRLVIGGISDGTVDYGDGGLTSSGTRDLLLLKWTR